MEQHKLAPRCPNCGTNFAIADSNENENVAKGAIRCPICLFAVTGESLDHSLSVEDFEARISTIIDEARSGGVSPDLIVKVLSDELAFTAEVARGGRRQFVQLIDLGPPEIDAVLSSESNKRELLLSRGARL